MSDRAHLDAFLHAMHTRDSEGTLPHMTETVTLFSPLLAEPVSGKASVGKLLKALHQSIDAFEMDKLIGNETDYVAIFKIRSGDVTVEGMDHMRLDETGLVQSMTIAWRPLAQVVGLQQKLAATVGFPPLQLTPLCAS